MPQLRRFLICSTTVLVISGGLATAVAADTFTVPCDTGSLIRVINKANDRPGSVIELTAGCSYSLTALAATPQDSGPVGLPPITANLTINGNHAMLARAPGVGLFRILTNSAATTIRDLTITGGHATTGPDSIFTPALFQEGGGILNTGDLTLTGDTIRDNSAGDADQVGAGGDGGGIYNVGSLTIDSSVISGNATGHGGVGIPALGVGGPGGNGGGIETFGSGTVTITRSVLRGNTAGRGGAAGPGDANVSGDGGAGGDGGGIYLVNQQLTMSDTLVIGNHAGDGGNAGDAVTSTQSGGNGGRGGDDGGILVSGRATGMLTRVTICDNRAGDGGSAGSSPGDDAGWGGAGGSVGALSVGSRATVTVADSLLCRNSAGSGGLGTFGQSLGGSGGSGGSAGAVEIASLNPATHGRLTMLRSVVLDNAAGAGADGGNAGPGHDGGDAGPGGSGGAFTNVGDLSISDSLIAGNRAGRGGHGGDGGAFVADFRAGSAGAGGGGGDGGAILQLTARNRISSLTVTNSMLRDNAAGDAGAAGNVGPGAVPVTGSVPGTGGIGGDGGSGGALDEGDAVGTTDNLAGTIMTGNRAGHGGHGGLGSGGTGGDGGSGGAILVGTGDTVNIGTSQLADNTAGPAGAAFPGNASGIDGTGGGIGLIDPTGHVMLTSAAVIGNHPDNCAPAGAVVGCTG